MLEEAPGPRSAASPGEVSARPASDTTPAEGLPSLAG